MNKRQKPSQKMKGATVAAVLCFVAAIAIVGTYTFSDYKRIQREEQFAKAVEDDTKEEEKEEPAEEANNLVFKQEEPEPEAEEEPEELEIPAPAENTDNNPQTGVQSTAGSSTSINFSEDSKLLWPVNGSILMSYSMDKTVYFSTLDQYKYNPAVIISGAEGDQVLCGTTGIVKSIDITAETQALRT